MNYRFSIGRKISLGFAVIILATIIAFYYTNQTFEESRQINDRITNNHNPSIAQLESLKLLIVRSKMLINNWVYQPSPSENEDKVALNKLSSSEYPQVKHDLEELSEQWVPEQQELLRNIFSNIEMLWASHDMIKQTLTGIESYNDPTNQFLANSMVEEGGEIDVFTDDILAQLNELIEDKKEASKQITSDMLGSFQLVQALIRNLSIALALAGIIIAFLTTRSIVSPVQKVRVILLDLSKGIFPNTWFQRRNDEIGDMANALKTVVAGLKRTKDFATDVGSGNYTTEYQPLSDKDELGQSLIVMRNNLKEYSEEMEEKVRERTAEVVRQKEEIQKQSEQIAELYEQVKDSILYAKRIQEAILPSREEISKTLREHLILFRPKDIVSGDFYWFTEKKGKAVIAAADCTGHGVPGALMSMIGSSLLNEIVNEKNITTPNEILLALKQGVIKALNKHPSVNGQTKDGMDIAMCTIETESNRMEFAGAYNPLFLIRDGELITYNADRQPVGIYGDNEDTPYTNYTIDLQKGDAIYIFSDGYADQFGGPNGKKFKYSQFKKLLLGIQDKPMGEQREILNQSIEEWMGEEEQIDDILVIGVKF